MQPEQPVRPITRLPPRTIIAPMLAAPTPANLESLRFPLYASPKLNGIRCLGVAGKAQTRSGKLVPNLCVQKAFSSGVCDGLDGELIVGDPCHNEVLPRTVSGVMTMDSIPTDLRYYVFDMWQSSLSFRARKQFICGMDTPLLEFGIEVVILHPLIMDSVDDLLYYEKVVLELGYEGLVTRNMDCKYKNGRSTPIEQGMVKIKRFLDSEAVIVGYKERMHNDNRLEQSELGYAKRSTAWDGKIPTGTLGSFECRDVHTSALVSVGTGYTDAERAELWQYRDQFVAQGQLLKYKYFPIGMVDNVPLLPSYLGLRAKEDMS